MDQGPQHKTRYTESNRKCKNLEIIGTGGNFLNTTPMTNTLRSRIDKWDLKKLERFGKAKDIANKTNCQTKNWEKKILH